MSGETAFRPSSETKTIAASTTSASATFNDKSGPNLRIFNATSAIVFVRWGLGLQTAVATDLPIAPNAVEVVGANQNCDTVAVLLSTGTGNIYVTKGDGV